MTRGEGGRTRGSGPGTDSLPEVSSSALPLRDLLLLRLLFPLQLRFLLPEHGREANLRQDAADMSSFGGDFSTYTLMQLNDLLEDEDKLSKIVEEMQEVGIIFGRSRCGVSAHYFPDK